MSCFVYHSVEFVFFLAVYRDASPQCVPVSHWCTWPIQYGLFDLPCSDDFLDCFQFATFSTVIILNYEFWCKYIPIFKERKHWALRKPRYMLNITVIYYFHNVKVCTVLSYWGFSHFGLISCIILLFSFSFYV